MLLTIVKPDNLTLIDQYPQNFDLLNYVPGNLHALQWKNNKGHIEYTNLHNEEISELPDWADPIVQEHRRLTQLQIAGQEQEQRRSLHLQNGFVREERITKQRQQKLMKQQKHINQLVLENLE